MTSAKAKAMLFSAAASAALLLVLACRNEPLREEIRFQGSTMGTYYSVKIIPDKSSDIPRKRLYDEIQATLDAVDAAMSTFKDDSELTRFNQRQDDLPFHLSPETAFVFERAREIHHRSSGAFDITIGPLVDAWGFGPQGTITAPPSREEIDLLRKATGQDLLTLDAIASTIRKEDPSVHADLSAIAKGFGVDQVAQRLRDSGYEDFMVEVGGEVRVSGLNLASQPWRVAIERPVSRAQSFHRVLELTDIALATSGDYRNFIEIEGRRISHTIDPRTGYPVTHGVASVTV